MVEPAKQREPGGEIDWRAIEASPEFQDLVRKKRAFVLPGTIFFLAWYMGFILLTAYAESFMAERVYEGLTVGYCLALTQFVMVVVLGVLYLKRAGSVYDPLADKAIEGYAQHSGRYASTGGGGAEGGEDSRVGSRAAGTERGAPR